MKKECTYYAWLFPTLSDDRSSWNKKNVLQINAPFWLDSANKNVKMRSLKLRSSCSMNLATYKKKTLWCSHTKMCERRYDTSSLQKYTRILSSNIRWANLSHFIFSLAILLILYGMWKVLFLRLMVLCFLGKRIVH